MIFNSANDLPHDVNKEPWQPLLATKLKQSDTVGRYYSCLGYPLLSKRTGCNFYSRPLPFQTLDPAPEGNVNLWDRCTYVWRRIRFIISVIDRGQNHFDRGRNHFDRGRIHFDRGQKELDRGQKELDRGQKELDRGQKEFDRGQK